MYVINSIRFSEMPIQYETPNTDIYVNYFHLWLMKPAHKISPIFILAEFLIKLLYLIYHPPSMLSMKMRFFFIVSGTCWQTKKNHIAREILFALPFPECVKIKKGSSSFTASILTCKGNKKWEKRYRIRSHG